MSRLLSVSHHVDLALPASDPVTVNRDLLNRAALPRVLFEGQADDIPAAAVTEPKIGTGAVSTRTIANDAVVTAKIPVNAITSDRIANDAVVTAKIPINAITSDRIANDAVVTSKIPINAITSDRIANDAVVTAKIPKNAITTDRIANNAITLDKLPASGIPPAKISGVYDSGWIASGIVTATAVKAYPHGLGDYPGEVHVWLRWPGVPPTNFAVNEAVSLGSFLRHSQWPIVLSCDATNVTLNIKNQTDNVGAAGPPMSSNIDLIDKTAWGSVAANLTTAEIRIVARLTSQTGI